MIERIANSDSGWLYKIRYWKAEIISQPEDPPRVMSDARPPANNTPFTLAKSHALESKVVAPREK